MYYYLQAWTIQFFDPTTKKAISSLKQKTKNDQHTKKAIYLIGQT